MLPFQRFGRLITIRRLPRSGPGQAWLFKCDCGNEHIALLDNVRRGQTKSCGCFQREFTGLRATSHGHSRPRRSKIYLAWRNAIARCFDPNDIGYKNYGGRGITVCDEWRHDFQKFLQDIGPPPSPKHSIDRYPDNDGDYEPGNVRWATAKQQRENQRPRSKKTMESGQCPSKAL